MSDVGLDLGPDTGLDLNYTNPPPSGLNIEQETFPDYRLNWLEPLLYIPGEDLPLKWSITRPDGLSVAVPDSAMISVKDVINRVDVGTPFEAETEGADAATSQITGQLWAPPDIGIYEVMLTVAFGSQIRKHRQTLVIR